MRHYEGFAAIFFIFIKFEGGGDKIFIYFFDWVLVKLFPDLLTKRFYNVKIAYRYTL